MKRKTSKKILAESFRELANECPSYGNGLSNINDFGDLSFLQRRSRMGEG